jgi:P27 family predicted phage terminase small subunit
MSRAGRTPMPDRWKAMAGNPGRRPLGLDGPQFSVGVPPCPDHLDETARREWERIVPELQLAGLLAAVDGAALALYCVAYSRWCLAERKIAALAALDATGMGLVTRSPNGFEQMGYWYVVSSKAQEQLFRYLAEFGLSPVARARVKGASLQGDLFGNDALGAFMRAAPDLTNTKA